MGSIDIVDVSGRVEIFWEGNAVDIGAVEQVSIIAVILFNVGRLCEEARDSPIV